MYYPLSFLYNNILSDTVSTQPVLSVIYSEAKKKGYPLCFYKEIWDSKLVWRKYVIRHIFYKKVDYPKEFLYDIVLLTSPNDI